MGCLPAAIAQHPAMHRTLGGPAIHAAVDPFAVQIRPVPMRQLAAVLQPMYEST